MAPPKSLLRERIEKVLSDGLEHSIDDIRSKACNGLVVLPGVAARIVERRRRRLTPNSERRRNRDVPPEWIVMSAERDLVRARLYTMVVAGRAERVRPGIYRAISGAFQRAADSGDF